MVVKDTATLGTPGSALVNSAKIVGEVLLPGTSLTVDGDVRRGVAHAAVAIAAGFLVPVIAPVVVVAAGLNSYSTSVTGKSLVEQFDWRNRA